MVPWYLVGTRFHTDEHIVADLSSGKVMRTRSVTVDPAKITAEDLGRITGKPWAPNGAFEEQPRDIGRAIEPEAEVERIQLDVPVRNVRITEKVLSDFGFTADCLKCRGYLEGTRTDGISHSEACRIRLEAKMAQDEKYKQFVDNAKRSL